MNTHRKGFHKLRHFCSLKSHEVHVHVQLKTVLWGSQAVQQFKKKMTHTTAWFHTRTRVTRRHCADEGRGPHRLRAAGAAPRECAGKGKPRPAPARPPDSSLLCCFSTEHAAAEPGSAAGRAGSWVFVVSGLG